MRLWFRLRSALAKRKLDVEMSEEMRLHLERRTEENLAAGMSRQTCASLAFRVAQRTREIGVRVALGATVRDVVALALRQGAGLVLAGGGLGLAAAFGLTRYVAALLYGVSPADPTTFVLVLALLLVVALLACWLPARRAAKVDPMIALRSE